MPKDPSRKSDNVRERSLSPNLSKKMLLLPKDACSLNQSSHSLRSLPSTSQATAAARPRTNGIVIFLLVVIATLEMQRFWTDKSSLLSAWMGANVMPGVACMTPLEDSKMRMMHRLGVNAEVISNSEADRGISSSQLALPLSSDNPTIPSTTNANNIASASFPANPEHPRRIVLFHVGKAGGITLRQNTAAGCENPAYRLQGGPEVEAQLEACKSEYPPGLAQQTRHLVHMRESPKETVLEGATTFLVTLRNPIDRIVSVYRYSHPDNCEVAPASWGCHMKNTALLNNGTQGHQLFVQCFPTAAMEEFAQSLVNPWFSGPAHAHLSEEERFDCRRLAKTFVQGKEWQGIVAHFTYNYQHYAEAMRQYPDKEVMAVRTEHETADLKALDLQLGGTGRFRYSTHYSHGSEHYKPSPITETAYHKLCCVLEKEVEIYLELLHKSINLEPAAKQESEDDLKAQCGVTASWMDWRLTCLRGMDLGTNAEA